MKILLVGSGGREHALAWKLSRSPQVEQLWVAPGNGGTADLPQTENVAIDADNLPALLDFARSHAADLTVVGPEAPLVAGIVDQFQAAGLPIFGPPQAAAQLEGSKAFAKQFMQRHAIPTATAEIFDDFDLAVRALREMDEPPVIKASGLAAGKGVVVPESMEEAAIILRQMLLDQQFGSAGRTVVVEERLSGPELSVLAFCDGRTARILPPAQDHKRLLDDDQGPNTGGMGAFAPSPLATAPLLAEVEETILRPTLAGIAATGTPYVGVLYLGLMLTAQGPRLLEYNCRFGDPEAQVLLPLLQSDLPEILLACVTGTLERVQPVWMDGAGATVVMASHGYPAAKTLQGVPITGIDAAERLGCTVFQAGTKRSDDGRLVTSGGRVLAVTATAPALDQAVARAYAGVERIHFNQAHFRWDIGRAATAPQGAAHGH